MDRIVPTHGEYRNIKYNKVYYTANETDGYCIHISPDDDKVTFIFTSEEQLLKFHNEFCPDIEYDHIGQMDSVETFISKIENDIEVWLNPTLGEDEHVEYLDARQSVRINEN